MAPAICKIIVVFSLGHALLILIIIILLLIFIMTIIILRVCYVTARHALQADPGVKIGMWGTGCGGRGV